MTSIVIDEDGILWVCGKNDCGQLGLGDHNNRYIFTRINNINTYFENISNIGDSSYALDYQGFVWSCGKNDFGQLGFNHYDNVNNFTRIDAIRDNIIKISNNVSHFMFLDAWCLYGCGSNEFGKLGININIQHTLLQNYPRHPIIFSDISCGENHTIGAADFIYTWGSNMYGQLGYDEVVTHGYEQQRYIDNVNYLDYFYRATGIPCPYCDEACEFYRSTFKFKKIISGNNHNIAIDGNDFIRANGNNNCGQLGTASDKGLSIITAFERVPLQAQYVACGNDYTMVIDMEEQLWCGGSNNYGKIGLEEINQTSSKEKMCKKNKNHIFIKANIHNVKFKQIQALEEHSLLIDEDNKLWCCGSNLYGQLGLGYPPENNRLYENVKKISKHKFKKKIYF